MSLAAGIIAAAAGTAASSIGSTAVNAAISQDQAGKARDLSREQFSATQFQNYEMQRRDLAWQERMANTAYQRAVKDMEAAGINPASLGNTSPASAASAGSHRASGGSGASSSNFTGAHLDFGSAYMSSAINAVLAKDEKARKIFTGAVADNAKHYHAMEEAAEAIEGKMVKDYMQQQGVVDWKDLDFDQILSELK